jgi:hypothetical protein
VTARTDGGFVRCLAARRVSPVVETESFELIRHYVMHENIIGFQIPIGPKDPSDRSMVFRPISERDLPPGNLILGQMRGRALRRVLRCNWRALCKTCRRKHSMVPAAFCATLNGDARFTP